MFALCVSMAMLVAMCVVWTYTSGQVSGLVSARQGAPKCVLSVLTLQIIHKVLHGLDSYNFRQ